MLGCVTTAAAGSAGTSGPSTAPPHVNSRATVSERDRLPNANDVYYVKSRMRLAGTRRRRPPRTGGRTFRLKSGKQMADELGMSSVKLMPGPPPQCEPSGNSLEEETCRSEDGFTLIELMVVLLILAI